MFKKREFAIMAVAAFFIAVPVLASTVFNIDSSGNVGIGNSAPQNKLDVSGAIYSRLVTASSSAIDWSEANVQSTTLTSSPTLTFSNAQAGGEYKLIVNQDGTGGRTITWPASVIWENDTAPALTAAANSTDMMSFVYDGSRYLGTYALNFASTTPSPLLTDLLGYWKLDESSGNASDSSGNGYTLTNHSSVSYASGIINNGAVFSGGTTNYLGNASFATPGGDFTVSTWSKLTALPSNNIQWAIVSGDNVVSGMHSFKFYWYTNSGGSHFLRVNISSNGTIPIDHQYSFTPSTGTWYNIVLTYNASSGVGELWVNGSSLGTFSYGTSALYPAGEIDLGLDGPGNNALDGMVDETGIWDRILNSTEIGELYNSGAACQYPFSGC